MEVIDAELISGLISILLFSWCIGVLVYEAKRRGDHILQNFIYNKYSETTTDICSYCGCTELLCGHNGPGCIIEEEDNENI